MFLDGKRVLIFDIKLSPPLGLTDIDPVGFDKRFEEICYESEGFS
jgi:hypothetical protein